MSLRTWKAEFYPKDAIDCTPEESVGHSHQKWVGLLPENLKKHDCKLDNCNLSDDNNDSLYIDNETCSLCVNFYKTNCSKCPLAISRADRNNEYVSCDKRRFKEKLSPWQDFIANTTVSNMIHWLDRAVADQK